MGGMQEQQQQQQAIFKPEKILFVQLGKDPENPDEVIFEKMWERDYKSEVDLKNKITNVLKNIQIPTSATIARCPVNEDERARLPIMCNRYQCEIVFYIPQAVGTFIDGKKPFDLKTNMTFNPRAFYLEGDELRQAASLPSGSSDDRRRLAVFSYRGEEAVRSRIRNYSFIYKINVESKSGSIVFPGNGDVGHPGGDHP